MLQHEAYVQALMIERHMRAEEAQLRAEVRAVRRKRAAQARAGVIRRLLAAIH